MKNKDTINIKYNKSSDLFRAWHCGMCWGLGTHITTEPEPHDALEQLANWLIWAVLSYNNTHNRHCTGSAILRLILLTIEKYSLQILHLWFSTKGVRQSEQALRLTLGLPSASVTVTNLYSLVLLVTRTIVNRVEPWKVEICTAKKNESSNCCSVDP